MGVNIKEREGEINSQSKESKSPLSKIFVHIKIMSSLDIKINQPLGSRHPRKLHVQAANMKRENVLLYLFYIHFFKQYLQLMLRCTYFKRRN